MAVRSENPCNDPHRIIERSAVFAAAGGPAVRANEPDNRSPQGLQRLDAPTLALLVLPAPFALSTISIRALVSASYARLGAMLCMRLPSQSGAARTLS